MSKLMYNKVAIHKCLSCGTEFPTLSKVDYTCYSCSIARQREKLLHKGIVKVLNKQINKEKKDFLYGP